MSRFNFVKFPGLKTSTDTTGAGIGEYALIAALVAGVSALAVTSLGVETRDTFSRISNATQETGGGSGAPGPGEPDFPGEPAPGETSPGENFAITLGGASLPQASVQEPWSYDFSNLVALQDQGGVTVANLTWSGGAPALPSWLSIDPQTGVASGVPDALGPAEFEIIASYPGADGRQIYVLDIGGVQLAVTSISAGSYHTCAIDPDGGAWCWGYNNYGQLGDDSTTNRARPVRVFGLSSGIVQISAGDYHSCAVDENANAWCWGRNGNGRLGDDTTTTSARPVQALLPSGAKTIDAGDTFTCAIDTSDVAWCWGDNTRGRLGNGTTTSSRTPVAVLNLGPGVKSISTSLFGHACAIDANDEAWCWGYSNGGQVGFSTTLTNATPGRVQGLPSGIMRLEAGHTHSCAIDSVGALWCWGTNGRGELGDGTTEDRVQPAVVNGLSSGVRDLGLGRFSSCAIDAARSLWCWGDNDYGQIGDNTTTRSSLPVHVSTLTTPVDQVTSGGFHTCASDVEGGLWCWGRGSFSQIGDGFTSERRIPTAVDWQ